MDITNFYSISSPQNLKAVNARRASNDRNQFNQPVISKREKELNYIEKVVTRFENITFDGYFGATKVKNISEIDTVHFYINGRSTYIKLYSSFYLKKLGYEAPDVEESDDWELEDYLNQIGIRCNSETIAGFCIGNSTKADSNILFEWGNETFNSQNELEERSPKKIKDKQIYLENEQQRIMIGRQTFEIDIFEKNIKDLKQQHKIEILALTETVHFLEDQLNHVSSRECRLTFQWHCSNDK